MARIRTIKPEFPQSESMGRVSRDARLLFIMLWTICDDEGRSRASSRMLASLLFPYDNDAISLMDGWLSELETEGCIHRYGVGTSTYLVITKWLNHQKIDKPSASRLPKEDNNSRKVASILEVSSGDLVPSTKDLGRDQDQDLSALAAKRFEDFYSAFPKKEKRKDAETLFAKVSLTVDPQRLIVAASKYAKACHGKEPRFISGPISWLEHERWLDGETNGAGHNPFQSPEEIEGQRLARERAYGGQAE